MISPANGSIAPGLAGTGRHHVDMAGEGEVAAALPELGVQIVDRIAAVALEDEPAAGEAQRLQPLLQQIQRRRRRRA